MTRGLAAVLVVAWAGCSRAPPSLDHLHEQARDALERGDLEKAQSWAEQGRKAAVAADEDRWERAFRVVTAEVLVSQRKVAEAIKLLDELLAVRAPDDEDRARALMTRSLGLCLSPPSDELAKRSREGLDQAAAIAARLGSGKLLGEISLRRGSCFLLRKQSSSAEASFRAALAVAQRERLPSLEADASGSLGLLRVDTERYDEAADWLRRSLELATAVKNDRARAKTLQNLGWCYYNLGDFDRAVSYLSDAEKLTASLHLTGDRVRALLNLGNCFFQTNDLDTARDYYGRALDAAKDVGDETRVARVLVNLALVALDQARYEEAEAVLQQGLAAAKAVNDDAGQVQNLLIQAHVRAGRGFAAEAEALYRRVISSPAAEPALVWEAWSGLAVVHVRAGRAADAEKEFGEAFAVMERSQAQIGVADHRIAFFSSLRRFHDEHVDFLIESGHAEQALVVADRGRARLLTESLRPQAAEGGAQAYRKLAADLGAVLLFYWTAPRRSFVWVVTPERVTIRVLAGDAEMARRVAAYQARIQRSRDPLADGEPDGTWLYGALIAPIQDQLSPGKRVVIVPDGPLHQLNFETLVVPGPRPHYWIEDVTLATAPSLGLLSGGPARVRPDASILVIGDPVSPSEEFPALPFARREVEHIAALFGPAQAQVRSGGAAKPSAYAAAKPGGFAFIHFAAHATANHESPLDSAVVLSGRHDDYKLYARDIVQVPLTAELVTLSACRSAGSRAFAGEGLVGLAWAFLGSGARNVVGGLWNVEDASTADLMEHLYRGLRGGLDPIAALREAKLRMIRSGTANRKPYYWAPFVVYTRGG